MANTTMKGLIMTFVLLIIGLALTPAVASFTTDAKYQAVQDIKAIAPLTANSTVLTYQARNDSTTYGYFSITLDPANMYSQTNVDVTTNITYTVSSKTLAFKTGVLDDGETYDATIDYYTDDLSSAAVLALVALAPLLWVVILLAVGIVAIYEQLKHSTG